MRFLVPMSALARALLIASLVMSFGDLWSRSYYLRLRRLGPGLLGPRGDRVTDLLLLNWISRFPGVVRVSWSQPLQASDPITMVICKLRRLKQTLRLWNKTDFGNLNVNIAAAKTTLADIQEQIYTMGDSTNLFDSVIEATVKLHRLLN
ncbi:hypothetical protein ACS0TY_021992 [Phlomoides rotata]